MNTTLQVLHNGHKLSKAFNTQSGLPLDVIYCTDCAGHFHGCYCDDVENCFNCEALPEITI
jgi:hypothetical protein